MLKLPLLLPFWGMSVLWSGAVSSSEIQPLRLVSTAEPVSAVERVRAADPVVAGERDVEKPVERSVELKVEVARSALLQASTPPMDLDRIAAIRQALDDGSYRLQPARIADAMIAQAQALGSSR